jgi:hypothetical protein
MGKFTSKEITDAILWDSHKLTVSQISEKYRMNKVTVRALLRRNGAKPLKKSSILPKEVLAEVLKDGWLSSEELCKRCNSSYHIVNKSLKAYGIIQGRKPTVRHRIHQSNRAFKVLGYIMANPEMPLDLVSKQFLCTREFVSQIEAMARQEGIIK